MNSLESFRWTNNILTPCGGMQVNQPIIRSETKTRMLRGPITDVERNRELEETK